jgi:hypothetical protein
MRMTCHIVQKQQCATAVILLLNAVSHLYNTCDVNYKLLLDSNTTTLSDAHTIETQKFPQLKILFNYFNDFNPALKVR